MRSLTALVLGACALAGCATAMSGRECRDAVWEELGYEDGVRGEPASVLGRRREACAGEGPVNDAEWRRGYERGIAEFCTPAGGYRAGRENAGETSLCAGRPGEAAFRVAYQDGGKVYGMLSDVRERYRKLRIAASQRADAGLGLKDTEFVRSLKRREAWLKQRDGELSDRYGVEPLTDDDLDPERVR